MKHIIQFLIVMFSTSSIAQDLQVRVTYEGIFNIKKYDEKLNDRKTSKDEKQRLLAWISTAKSMTEKTYTLELTRSESIFEEREKLSLNTKSNPSINTSSNDREVYYKNLSENRYVRKTSLTGKRYLIVDSLETFDWQLSQETKKIGKYICHKATHVYKGISNEKKENKNGTFEYIVVNTDFLFTAWYTIEIPISNGPKRFGGLPGLILEVDFYDTSKWVCTEIEFNPPKKIKITAPTGGKKVTNEEYEKDIGYVNPRN